MKLELIFVAFVTLLRPQRLVAAAYDIDELQDFDPDDAGVDGKNIIDDSTVVAEEVAQNRASDPRDHTATKDIEDINSYNKPRSDVGIAEHFERGRAVGEQLFEGCIKLDEKDKELLSKPSDTRSQDKKTHITLKDKMWPSNVIPYEIVFTGTKDANKDRFQGAVFGAINTISQKTCIRFRKNTPSDLNWIMFFSGTGCWSELGRKYWKKEATYVSLDVQCWKESIATHELLHALGFFHEQNRYDRDDYVRINWQNIIDGKSMVFHRHNLFNTDMYHFEYDYNSIMHYSRLAYSKGNGRMTIEAVHNKHKILGSNELSKLDIEKLQKMFCPGGKPGTGVTPVTPLSNWTPWTTCSKTCGLGQRFRKEKCKGGNDCANVRHEMKVCRLKKCQYSMYDTNFDEGGDTGMWKLDPTSKSECEWAHEQASDTSVDHTTGRGGYLYVDTNKCGENGAANLYSDWIERNKQRNCLDFYYLMNGRGVGVLQVYLQFQNRDTSLLWERIGDQGQEWKQGAATLPVTEKKYKIFFHFIARQSRAVKLKLDDVYIDDGKCLQGIQKCTNAHPNCGKWAKKGECFLNSVYMMRSCCLACSEFPCEDKLGMNKCLAKTKEAKTCESRNDLWSDCCKSCQDCLDKDSRCKEWAENGECQKNYLWMKRHCMTSCKSCDLSPWQQRSLIQ